MSGNGFYVQLRHRSFKLGFGVVIFLSCPLIHLVSAEFI
ncbi:DUF2933 domain-containing protein [Candidatus Falkowbacteria bacterium]|nr:DUF2933 domain-containing protein [Candidatus Falkowbacteria bacterium]